MFTDRWMHEEDVKKKNIYIYIMEYYAAIKKNERMYLEIIILSEVSQRKTNIIWYHLYIES